MKYQKVAECPLELQEIMDLVNSVPLGKENFLPSAASLVEGFYFKQTGKYPPLFEAPANDRGEWDYPSNEEIDEYKNSQKEALLAIEEMTKRFPRLYSYIFEEPKHYNAVSKSYFSFSPFGSIGAIAHALEKYDEFLDSRRTLRFVAQKCTLFVNKGWGETNSIAFSKFEADFTQTLYFRIIEGRTVFVGNRIIQLLEDIDAKRLRICPICKDVFWAKRIEAKTCPKRRCSNNFHQRKLRIKEYEKRLDKELKALEKLQSSLSAENSLIAQQSEKVNKFLQKINQEKMKNGNL